MSDISKKRAPEAGELPRLGRDWLRRRQGDDTLEQALALPERVLQFGEGNFLRAFVDWMLQRMNERGSFGGRALVVQPIAQGNAERVNQQDGLYTVLLRGVQGQSLVDSRELVSCVSRCLDPYRDFSAFLASARQPELRFVVSNTTEAGIRTDPNDAPDAKPSPSFPGKLTQWLYARYQHFEGDPSRGVVLLPCELIERNGDALRRTLEETARAFSLPHGYLRWLRESCIVTNTLVDRIVTGYPADEAPALWRELGYRDELLVAGEPFLAWVIEAPMPLEDELPLAAAGIDVVWTDDMTPYRERKVRILNGAHTLLVLAAFLDGKNTVKECMDDPLWRGHVERAIHEEILPTLELPKEQLEGFAASVLERFANPFIRHQLLSIALNSVSKYKARVLSTMLDQQKAGRPARRLAFGLAALIAFYRGSRLEDGRLIGDRDGEPYPIADDPAVLEFFRDAWGSVPKGTASLEDCQTLVESTLAREDFWGPSARELSPELRKQVALHLHAIDSRGVRSALEGAAGA